MQCLKVEYQIEFADILKKMVERLDKHMDKVQERERRLGRRADEDKVQRCVVPVGDERRRVRVCAGRGGRGAGRGEERWEGQEVAGRGGPG